MSCFCDLRGCFLSFQGHEGKGPIAEATWDKGSFLEAELVEKHDLCHFVAERLYFGYGRGLFPCWRLSLPLGCRQAASLAWAEPRRCVGRFLQGQFCGDAVHMGHT